MKLLATPGSPPILSEDALGYWESEMVMRESLGDPERIRSVCVKFPIPTFDPRVAGSSRFRGVSPDHMGHPLLWLPLELTAPAPIEKDVDGGYVFESNDHRALRVAYHLLAAGLVDGEDGEWVDVLAAHGFDASDPTVRSRLEAWAAGGADEELDTLDVSALYRLDLVPATYVATLSAFDVLRDTALFMVLGEQFGTLHELCEAYSDGEVGEESFETGCVVAASLTQFVALNNEHVVPDDLVDLYEASEELLAVFDAQSSEELRARAVDYFLEQMESVFVELGEHILDFFDVENEEIRAAVPFILGETENGDE